ncbi:MAG: hypothetical protein COA47_10405 [Robiginitomaculum sp.]|nr:MAG: hypothetical protein COA47_10405 [Robiginitomaculum sp.]
MTLGIAYGGAVGTVTYVDELRSECDIDQSPTGTDVPLTVIFGDAQGGPTDNVALDAGGVISINLTGFYSIQFKAQYGRSGAAGTSWIYFRTMVAFDGVNFIQPAGSTLTKITNSNEDQSITERALLELQQGWKLKVEIMRGSEGNDSGGLIATVPAEGTWMTSFSSEVTVQRVVWVPS